jgi:hypothetical protein
VTAMSASAITARHVMPVVPGGKLLVALAALLLAGTLLGGPALAALVGDGRAPAVPITTPAGTAIQSGGQATSTSRSGAGGAPTVDLADDPRTPGARGAGLA